MRKEYKVISLAVGGKGSKIFRSGDIVIADNFYEGRAEELVKSGHLENHKSKPNSADENIELIEACITVDAVNEILSNDDRKKVVKAGHSKIEELEGAAEAQAAVVAVLKSINEATSVEGVEDVLDSLEDVSEAIKQSADSKIAELNAVGEGNA